MRTFEQTTAATLLEKINECQKMQDFSYSQSKTDKSYEERFAYWVNMKHTFVQLAIELYEMPPHDILTEDAVSACNRVQQELKLIAGE